RTPNLAPRPPGIRLNSVQGVRIRFAADARARARDQSFAAWSAYRGERRLLANLHSWVIRARRRAQRRTRGTAEPSRVPGRTVPGRGGTRRITRKRTDQPS